MKTKLYFWFTIWYFFVSPIEIISEKSEKALIFDREKNSLIAVPTTISHRVSCDTWVAACPVEEFNELNFEEKYSFRNAALFVDRNYHEKMPCANFQSYKCYAPYRLSIAWFHDAIEFGYEIYLQNSIASNFGFTVSPYDDYESLKYFSNLKSYSWREFFNYLKNSYKERKQNQEKSNLEMHPRLLMEFIWIPLFKVWFRSNRFRKLEYQIRKNNVTAKLSCEDYSLGNEMFYDGHVDSLYSVENQEQMLKKFKLPPSTDENACESKYNCFSKWLLIPSDQFQFNSSSSILCSNLVTVPIWTSTIKPILQKLDDYLYALSRVSGQPLRIVAGVNGIIKFPRAEKTKWLHNSYAYFTYEKKINIPVPNIIYKIVKFRINQCETGADFVCWYGVIIVIHNNPFFEANKLICDDLTEELGWSEIKYEKLSSEGGQKPSKYIYVCAINRKSIEGVGLTYNWSLLVNKLSLVKFPDRDSNEFATINVKDEVFKELKRLSEEGATLNVNDDEVIERPSLHDMDFDVYNDEVVESLSVDDIDLTVFNNIQDQEPNSESDEDSQERNKKNN